MSFPKEHKYTAEEYFNLSSESETERCELIDGELLNIGAPSELHQTILLRAGSRIDNYILANKGECKVMISPFDVIFDEYNVV